MQSHLERNFNYDDGNDAFVAEAEKNLKAAAGNLRHAIEAARHESHGSQAGALEAIVRELEAKAELLRQMRRLKD